MNRAVCAFLGVGLSAFGAEMQADTLPMALPAPLPSFSENSLVEPAAMVLPIARRVESRSVTQLASLTRAQADVNAFGFPCGPDLTATSGADAIIKISVSAPCKPYETVQITYAGMQLHLDLGLSGLAELSIPALTKTGEIESEFEDGTGLAVRVSTPEISQYLRVAVIWDQAHDARLTAIAPRHLPIAMHEIRDATGRELQILSHHLSDAQRPGVIRLGLSAPITAENCAKARHATIYQRAPDIPPLTYDVAIAPTACDAVGDTLELKNILQDLKLAAQ